MAKKVTAKIEVAFELAEGQQETVARPRTRCRHARYFD